MQQHLFLNPRAKPWESTSQTSGLPVLNYELFQAVIGGYGACGIIVEATLKVVENDHIERIAQRMPLANYKKFFLNSIAHNPDVVLHNANILLPACNTVQDLRKSDIIQM